MPSVKICLLVSDDPDDHHLLSEALSDISKNIVLTILLEGNYLLRLLEEEKIRPDFIIVDTTMETVGRSFITALNGIQKLENVPVIIYTEHAENLTDFPSKRVLSKRSTYSEMRTHLKRLLLPPA